MLGPATLGRRNDTLCSTRAVLETQLTQAATSQPTCVLVSHLLVPLQEPSTLTSLPQVRRCMVAGGWELGGLAVV